MVGVPDLKRKTRWDLVLGLIPREHGFLLGDYDLLFGHQVVEWKDKPPIEIPLPGKGMVMDIGVLLIFLLTLQPPEDPTQQKKKVKFFILYIFLFEKLNNFPSLI